MKIMLERKYINLLLVAGVVWMVIFAALTSYQIAKLKTTNQATLHSHHVIERVDETIILLNSLDSAVRGYFITKNTNYLAEYNLLEIDIKSNLNDIAHLVSDDPKQSQRVMQFNQLVIERFSDINKKIDEYHKYGLSYLLNKYDTNNGIYKPKEIKNVGLSISEYEGQLLNKRNSRTIDMFNIINMMILLSCIIGFLLILYGVLSLNKQIDIRKKIENKLRKSENDLYQLAYHDPLTGLANRLLLYKMVEDAIAAASKYNKIFAILYIDVDNFKNVNDSLGHEIGDQLLKIFSHRLESLIDSPNVVARIGGDEFMIVLTEFSSIYHLHTIAKNILRMTITEPISIDQIDKKIFITTSIGISLYPDNGNDPSILIKNADIAMYHAKELGKNNYQFCSLEMAKKVEERAALEYHLHHAVSNDEFSLSYQPIVALHSHEIVAVEALIRWNKPNAGIIYPSDFIMIAESSGLIVPIGVWLLKKACHDAAVWHATNDKPITVAINISIRQFVLSDFVSIVKSVLQQTQFNPKYLEFEITESVLLENSQSNMQALKELKELGIVITIDDFGTGYSSLSYLQSFSVDKVKIDKSFINKITHDNQSSAIIKAIITMAHSLGMRVIAEGVEHEHHINFLKEHQCDEAQGYYFSHPIKSEDFHDYIRQRRNPSEIA
jgi:diguanylate cyclase (GGDEF)-like protein